MKYHRQKRGQVQDRHTQMREGRWTHSSSSCNGSGDSGKNSEGGKNSGGSANDSTAPTTGQTHMNEGGQVGRHTCGGIRNNGKGRKNGGSANNSTAPTTAPTTTRTAVQ